jgi:hypothetical protein
LLAFWLGKCPGAAISGAEARRTSKKCDALQIFFRPDFGRFWPYLTKRPRKSRIEAEDAAEKWQKMQISKYLPRFKTLR